MANIAIDIDSTLYNFDTIAREACLKLWRETGDEKYREGMYYSSEHWRSPADVMGTERWLKAIALCHDDEMILQQIPFAGAAKTCEALMEAGHNLIYISNRKTETERATDMWLYHNEFLPADRNSQARLVVTTGDKRPHIAECQYLIDDRLKTCVEFVYDYDWQRKHRVIADAHRLQGPPEGHPLWDKYVEAQDNLMEVWDDWQVHRKALPKSAFEEINRIQDTYAKEYLEKNRRRAFILQYQYNQNATDIPGCYVAPSWAGLNVYMERHGVLPEVAYEALT